MNKQIFQNQVLWFFISLFAIALVQTDGQAQFGDGDSPKVTAEAEFQLKEGSKTEGVVSVTVTVVEGFHIYSVTQKEGGPLPTRISVTDPQVQLKFGAFTPDKPAKIHYYEVAYGDLEIEEHTGKIVWTAPFTSEMPLETPATTVLKLQISSLACTDDLGICIPQKNEVAAAYQGYLKAETIDDGNDEAAAEEQPTGEPDSDGLGSSPFDLGGGFESPGLGGGFEPPGTDAGGKELEVTSSYYVNPKTGNGVVRVTVTVTDGFHIYSLTQKRGGPLPTILKVTGDGIQITGDVVTDKEPEIHHYEVYGELDVEEVKGTVNWDVPILGPLGDPTGLDIKVIVDALACTDNLGSCIPQKVNTTAKLDPSLVSVSFSPTNSDAGNESQSEGAAPSSGTAGQTDEMSLTVVLGFALLGGFILNFMPCVLPVIGLKIMSFVTQAGESRGKVFSLNLWYSLGLMTVFLIFASLAIFMGLGWGQQNQSDSFNIIMIAVIFVMGLSFIGVWEIPIPGFVGSSEMAKSAEKEGPVAAYLKGVITTLLAIPCSGPGLGVALTYCAKQMAQEGGTQGALNVYLVFFALGIGMAFPYLVIGAFPGLVRFLPKPGTWMETFKELMGYILLATIVFIMTYVRYSLIVPTIGFLFALWAGCWWYGRVPFTAPAPTKLVHRLGAIMFTSAPNILSK